MQGSACTFVHSAQGRPSARLQDPDQTVWMRSPIWEFAVSFEYVIRAIL